MGLPWQSRSRRLAIKLAVLDQGDTSDIGKKNWLAPCRAID